MAEETPSLDELILKESMRAEELSQAFIRFSLARNDVQMRLREVRENLPNVFTGEWNLNEYAVHPQDPDAPVISWVLPHTSFTNPPKGNT